MPTSPAAAAVVSTDIVAPRKTPCSQSKASVTSGTVLARRPPNRKASIGTPSGSSHSGAIEGHCDAGVGEAGVRMGGGVVGLRGPLVAVPVDRVVGRLAGHPLPPDVAVVGPAQLVKIVFRSIVSIAFGFVLWLVFGATPKKPASGLTA